MGKAERRRSIFYRSDSFLNLIFFLDLGLIYGSRSFSGSVFYLDLIIFLDLGLFLDLSFIWI